MNDELKLLHASDCAACNMPAMPNGPCDCGAEYAHRQLGTITNVHRLQGDLLAAKAEAATARTVEMERCIELALSAPGQDWSDGTTPGEMARFIADLIKETSGNPLDLRMRGDVSNALLTELSALREKQRTQNTYEACSRCDANIARGVCLYESRVGAWRAAEADTCPVFKATPSAQGDR